MWRCNKTDYWVLCVTAVQLVAFPCHSSRIRGLLSVCDFERSPCVHVGFFHVFWFSPTTQKNHAARSSGVLRLPLVLKVYVQRPVLCFPCLLPVFQWQTLDSPHLWPRFLKMNVEIIWSCNKGQIQTLLCTLIVIFKLWPFFIQHVCISHAGFHFDHSLIPETPWALCPSWCMICNALFVL